MIQQQDTGKKCPKFMGNPIHNREFNHICKYYSLCLESSSFSCISSPSLPVLNICFMFMSSVKQEVSMDASISVMHEEFQVYILENLAKM